MDHLLLAASSPQEEINLNFVNFSWWSLIVLGIVQGITELLPISSTAHLRIVPALMGLPDPGSAFSAAMQLASFTAVVAYFWRDINKILQQSWEAVVRQDYESQSFRLLMGILVGTIPLVVAGLALKKTLNAPDSPLRGLLVIGIASIVMSLLLAVAEKRGGLVRPFNKLTLKDGILVGIAQAFALIPGVSRSGSTLTAGLFLGMERETAARFSFLLGLPAITLAGAVELHTLLKAGLSSQGWIALLIGLTSASIAAFLAIFGLLRYLEERSTWIFVWYRLVMGILLVLCVALQWLPNQG